MSMYLKTYTAVLVCLLALSCRKASEPPDYPGTSWVSVLEEAVTISSIASPVQEWEKSLHFSSAAAPDKVLMANLAPEITGDMDHGFFLDVTEHADGVDATLAEVHGKGMISWMWSANPTGRLLIFLDEHDSPVVDVPFRDFLRGTFLPISSPFTAKTANGYNLHIPIIHTNYCKVVLRVTDKKDLASLYYQIAWNAIDPDLPATIFDIDQIIRGKDHLQKIKTTLREAVARHCEKDLKTVSIPPGGEACIFSSETAGTITDIELRTTSLAALGATRFLAYWDNEFNPAIDCPVYMLTGASEKMRTVKTVPVRVKGNGVSIHWPMPHKAACIVIRNISEKPLELAYAVQTENHSSAMRLHGQAKRFPCLGTLNKNILTLAQVDGSGRIAACNIQVKSRTERWWGEGDQLIYLDNTEKPTWCGTGTEDYFGFAWCSKQTFTHPFRGQSAVIQTGLRRTSAMYRFHLLARLPFQHQANFKTEAWGLSDGTMDYETFVLYYKELL